MDTEGQRFYDLGQPFRNAREILDQHCDFPPSLEGFLQELRDARRRTGRQLAPEIVARDLAAGYKRTNLYGY